MGTLFKYIVLAVVTVGCGERWELADESRLPIRFSTGVVTRGVDVGWDALAVDVGGEQQGVNSRGVPYTGLKFASGASFGVLSYIAKGQQMISCYTFNEKVTRHDDVYLTSAASYWPTEPLRFFAYTPYVAADDTTTIRLLPQSRQAAPTLEYTADARVENQLDLMAAATSSLSYTPFVWLNFNHVLTCVGFEFRSTAAASIKVKSITLSGVVTQGSVSLLPNLDGSYLWTPYRERVGEYRIDQQGAILPDGEQIVDRNYRGVVRSDGYMMLIPQSIDSASVALRITYTVDGAVRDTTAALPSTTWKSRQWISYRISLGR